MTHYFKIVFDIMNQVIFGYVLVVDLFYTVLFLLSLSQIGYFMKRIRMRSFQNLTSSVKTPPVSIIVPAFNEEKNIEDSLFSFLSIHYPEFEVILVNDGSTDSTLNLLIHKYQLIPIEVPVRLQIPTNPIKTIYRSFNYPSLIVVDKENGGKADALNVGINISNYPYFCSVDADSILERDALMETMQPFLEGKDDIVASGGMVRIANGSTVIDGRIERVSLPRNPIVIHQIIEYLRSFLMGRMGMSGINSLLIVSGAFGIFRKKEVLDIGGYDIHTVGEDMELIIRLQRYLYERKSKSRIIFVPTPICWTEAPSTLKSLYRQRTRWHIGLIQSLYKHKALMLNPKYKVLGLLAFPYFVIVELLGPTVELIGFILVIFGLYFDILNISFAVLFVMATFIFGIFLSMSAVLLEEMSFRKYVKIQDFLRLVLYAALESLWYRQLNAIWRTWAFILLPFQANKWGKMERKGFNSNTR